MYFLVQKAQNGRISSDLAVYVPNWPIKAIPCAKDAKVPDGWEMMTNIEIIALKKEHREAYDKWANKEKKKRVEAEKKEEQRKNDVKLRLKRKLENIGFNEEEIKIILKGDYPN